MRYILTIIIFLLASCATGPSSSKSITYQTVRSLKMGEQTSHEIRKVLGEPTSKTESDERYTYQYDDPKTGFQRLSLDFLAFNDKLDSALWIPRESEVEYSIDTVKADFKNASFETTPEKLNYSHSLNSVVFYKDIKSGVTIRYNVNSKAVEGIALYAPESRAPAKSK